MSNYKLHAWCLYNVKSKKLLSDLSVDGIRSIILAVDSLEDWYVWNENWTEWSPLSLCPDFQNQPLSEHLNPPEFNHNESTPPPVPINIKSLVMDVPVENSDVTFGYQSTFVNIGDIPDLNVEESDENNDLLKRSFERVSRVFDVEIEVEERVFQTQTVDVSVGGLRLKDPLPDWVVGYCLLRIIKSDKNEEVELVCSLVENQAPHEKYRLAFSKIDDAKKESKLARWLLAA